MGLPASVKVDNVHPASGGTYISRLYDHDGIRILKADLTSITYSVVDVAVPGTVVASGTITIATSVYDTLQTGDPRWPVDSTGWNFLWAYPVTIVPTAGRTYEVTITCTPVTGAVFKDVFRLRTR